MDNVSDASGDLTVSPRGQLVFVGDTVRLNCSTDSALPVNWWRTTVTSQEKEIFILNRTKSEYDGRLRIVRSAVGQFDLFIPHAELTDAGRYTCVDKAGGGRKVTVELIVLGEDMISKCTYVYTSQVTGLLRFSWNY